MSKQIFFLWATFLLLTACELASPASTPATATLTPITVPTFTLTPAMPSQPEAAAPSPTPVLPTDTPGTLGRVEELVPPQLVEAQPAQVALGAEVRVMGTGGYMRDSCGGYNESARNFPLYLDDQAVGDLGCYVNHCEGRFTLPDGTQPGRHCVSVEMGRCDLEIQVTGN